MGIRCGTIILFLGILLVTIATADADEIGLKNGDRISGKVIRMEAGKLVFKTSYAGEISVDWEEISTLSAKDQLKIVFSDETVLKGVTKPAEEGKMKLKMGKIVETVSFDLAQVKAINPKPKVVEPPVKTKGRVNLGGTVTKGNTDTETYHLDGEVVIRTVKNRYTIGAEFDKAEDDGEKTADSAFGYLKYDHFLNHKWFAYSNASFEKDDFKDLNLRTTLGAGVGFQFFETDLTNLSLEAGLAYVNEDFDEGEDDSYPAGRWAFNFDRYFYDKFVQFFHFHEGFIGFEDTNDIFVRSRTGLRFKLREDFNATTQYNYDWDNMPAPGREKADRTYILSLGYEW